MMLPGPVDVSVAELDAMLRPLVDRALFGFDVDGVLAPIVEHAEGARLGPGVLESLDALAAGTEIAIVSGRSLASLERLFAFPVGITVIGSHGLEVRGAEPVALDDNEQYTFDQLQILGHKTVEAIGDGAWLEHKPASVVVHTRSAADTSRVEPALEALENLAQMIDGAQVKRGHEVVELLARSASKGTALATLSTLTGRIPLVYFGDDLTDEDVFAVMSGDDVSVRVGAGATAARFRLPGPHEVADLLHRLAASG